MVNSSYFETFIMLCVIINTILMATENYITDKDLIQNFNLAFTIIFTIEMGLKIIGLGIIQYLKDKMNVFDCLIVMLSLVEVSYSEGSSNLGAFK
jgi:hypothetical protein